MRLVVNRTLAKVSEPRPPRTERARVSLRLLQGGQARPRRSPLAREAAPPVRVRLAADPVPSIEEVPIFLRPLPAWVPRLW